MIAGLPGVGKSTLARKIAQENDGVVLDIDHFKRSVVDPRLVTTQIDPPRVRWRYYVKAIKHALSLDTELVVMDEVFHLHALRERLENFCLRHEIEVEWIEARCSYQVVERRLLAKSRSGHILSTKESLDMYRLFQRIFERFPEGKRNHIVIDNSDE